MTSWGKTCNSGLYVQSYDRENQVKAVEKLLQIQSSEERFQNLTTKDFSNAAKMFLYLNTCPNSLKPWFVFYNDLFQNQPPNKIILTLNRLMKVTKTFETMDFQIIAQKLLRKSTTLFSLKHEEIRSIFPEQFPDRKENISFEEKV